MSSIAHDRPQFRLGFWKFVLMALIAAGVVVAVQRWSQGLGAVSNLSDRYPWGIWKAFNVLGGVAIGGAGFTIMGTVYVFHARRFQPIVKAAVLMAFLAYASAAATLFFDIGKSWAIWHPIVFWNHESILFDVSWCLMLYMTVLLLEGSGMLFERLGWLKLVRIQHAITLPAVMVGVLLSTMHQSSLGALFLISPGKLHALWYTPWLPVLFFVSAIALGFAMVIILARLAGKDEPAIPMPILGDVARVMVAILGVFGVIRVFDLAQRGVLGLAFDTTYEAMMFQLEFVLGVVLPMAILAVPKIRASASGLYVAAAMVALGFVANRLNVSITGFEAAQGGHYVPAVAEVIISLAVVAMAIVGFHFGARLLRVFPERGNSWGRAG
ncbi:MAG: Ni/Fe-hydrogenase cytochrome b subunit [Planctomycetes bacterium]|nr:Ni/Fe-hydrogenase cytochrome b subunit [Planctomycetota bacterium]